MNMVDMKEVGNDSDYSMPMASDCCPCIYLSSEQVEALGIKGVPAPGAAFVIQAQAVATSVTASAESDGDDAGPDVSLSLRLVRMGVAPASISDSERASVLYGG